jgi:hypothetical protein
MESTFAAEEHETTVDEPTAYVSPLSHTFVKTLRVKSGNKSPTFGLALKDDDINNRVFVDKVAPTSSASKLFSSPKATTNRIKGAFIIAINDTLVFSHADAIRILQQLYSDGVTAFDIPTHDGQGASSSATRS